MVSIIRLLAKFTTPAASFWSPMLPLPSLPLPPSFSLLPLLQFPHHATKKLTILELGVCERQALACSSSIVKTNAPGVVLKEEPGPSQHSVIFVAYRLLTFLADNTCTATHVHVSFSMSHPGTVAMATSDPDPDKRCGCSPLNP